MYNKLKKAICIHDISCLGRCSMQVITPMLSVLGVEPCVLPTALLSTHTGGFDDFTFLDLSDEMIKILNHWKQLNLEFDAVYSGFLANEKQIDIVNNAIDDFGEQLVLVDPVMGDNGHVYSTYTPLMCERMKYLVSRADIITPNVTEAYILANRPHNDKPDIDELKDIAAELGDMIQTKHKYSAVVITGIHKADQIGALIYDRKSNNFDFVSAPRCDCFFPGTGDIFASILLGKILNDENINIAARIAVDFISETSFYTRKAGTPTRDGLEFENQLYKLNQ
ncbi:MAG: hypothetical protein A2Y17_08405 [Clostridiales bacterium GWF2_38_85]|nr:MAG: hypothetical protein A2Y17_08405 [Clostridiales bacterium GWF2_38_85]HBL83786.1 pyridoxamine kinase [Clostridiales bacterium]